MNLNRYTRALHELDTVYVFSDFTDDYANLFNGISTSSGDDSTTVNLILASLKAFGPFVATLTDSGTAAIGDARNGVMTLTPSDGSVVDNDECYLASQNELFLFATNSNIYGKCKLRFTEVTATIANVGFGFMNAVGANAIVDDGAGLKVSGSTLGIYKVDGGAVWKCVSSCNGTSTVSTSTTAATAATDYILEIICSDWDGTSMQVSFKVDGVYLKDSNGLVIRHTVAIASATEMQVFAGIKLGASTNNDTCLIDYIYASQTRG